MPSGTEKKEMLVSFEECLALLSPIFDESIGLRGRSPAPRIRFIFQGWEQGWGSLSIKKLLVQSLPPGQALHNLFKSIEIIGPYALEHSSAISSDFII